jgi:lactoylglutathione lyase
MMMKIISILKPVSSVVLFFMFSVSLSGQSAGNLTLKFNHMALSVKDLVKSADFYKNILGLKEITNQAGIEGIRWFSLADGKELHLISVLKEPVTINKAVHIALSTNRFDDLIKVLEANRVEYSDWPGNVNKINQRPDGIKQVFFRDPDGYWLEVNSVVD